MAQSNEPTIDEKNSTIARFMGIIPIPAGTKRLGDIKPPEESIVFLNYHESWKLLMPVIEKISKMPLLNADNTLCTDPQDVCYPRTFGMPTEDGKQVMFRFNGFITHEADTLIEAAHKAVYEAAYYEINQQPQTNGQNNGGTNKG